MHIEKERDNKVKYSSLKLVRDLMSKKYILYFI